MWVWSNDPSIWGATDPLSPHKSAPATYQNQQKEVHFCGHWALWAVITRGWRNTCIHVGISKQTITTP